MKIITFLSLLFILLGACSNNDDDPTILLTKTPILGEWRYVGNFKAATDNKCIVCPEFNYDKSIYQITFNSDNTFSVRINFLIGKGTYTLKENSNSTYIQSVGDLLIKDFQILNKPMETEKDTEFKDNFTKISTFSQKIKASNPFGFDELNLRIQNSSDLNVI